MAIFRARIEAVIFSGAHHNRVHFEKPDSVPATDMPALATELRDNWCQFLKPGVPSASFNFTRIVITQVSTPTPAATHTLDVAIPATGSGSTQLIPFTTFNLRMLTDLGTRKGRGRMYFGIANPGNLTNGLLTPTTLTFWQNVCTQILNRYGPTGTSPFRLGLWSAGEGGGFHQVRQMFPDSIVRCQRRRNWNVGI